MTSPASPAGEGAGAELAPAAQAAMVQALRSRLPGGPAELIETHISFVLLAGGLAYKLKKVIQTAFLDQTTLAQRRHACQEELRLNRRLAPALYLAVQPVTGTPAAPELDGCGPPIDYAVTMKAFPQVGLWSALAARGALRHGHIDQLVAQLVPFHAAAAAADAQGRLGTAAQLREPVLLNLRELQALVCTPEEHGMLQSLQAWEAERHAQLQDLFTARLVQGRVRECHGDLHLGNVADIDGRTTVFDGIEFNAAFRWTDVMSDIAFMAMDLQVHGLTALARRFVNACLEQGGDYEGLRVLDYYRVHRALVRAKVALLRATQCAGSDPPAAAAERAAAARYLALAHRACRPARPVLMLTHGCSGSGKSTLTQPLLEALDAVRIRSDVERRRLAAHAPPAARYGAAMNAATYQRLRELAVAVLASGRHAILDATFLRRAERDAVRALAARLQLPCLILDFASGADAELLRRRVRQRAAQGHDASEADEAVLDAQLQAIEPLQPDELALACRVSAQPSNV